MQKSSKKQIVVLFLLLAAGVSSCSILRGRKCDCPQWSMETIESIPEDSRKDESRV